MITEVIDTLLTEARAEAGNLGALQSITIHAVGPVSCLYTHGMRSYNRDGTPLLADATEAVRRAEENRPIPT